MFYYWLKFMMRLAIWVYYRRISIHGFDKVPATGPVVFACNHPNSFLDAMIIGARAKREMHFLARSDVFNSPLKLWILARFNLIPIYRLQEGVENLEKNKDTFERCHKIFRNGGAVLIFSEGLCVQEMRLRPLKKGTARIAMEYIKDGSPLTIIPTGLNYMWAASFRDELVIGIDEPFDAAQFAELYRESPSKGINAFNKQLDAALHRVVIDVKDREHEGAIEQIIESNQHETNGDVNALVALAANLHALSQRAPEAYNQVIQSGTNYKLALERAGLRDRSLVRKSSLGAVATLFFALGHALFYLPTKAVVAITTSKVKRIEFHDSVLLGGSAILHFFYVLFVYLLVMAFFGWKVGLITVAAMCCLGYVAVVSFDAMRASREARKFTSLPSERQEELLRLRKEIVEIPKSVLHLVEAHQTHHPVG